MKKTISSVIIYFILSVFLIFTVMPLLWLLGLSLKTQLQAFSNPPVLFFKPTLEHYKNLFISSGFHKNFINSLIVSTMSTLLALLIGAPAAYGMIRVTQKNRTSLFVITLLTRMAPTMTYIIPFFILFSKTGLIDTRFSLIIAYQTFSLPMVIIIMRSFFLEIPTTLEEAATIDGASRLQAFLRIILPVSAQGLVLNSNFNIYYLLE